MARDRMVAGEEASDEQDFHWGLRPRSLDEYIGQPETVERLLIAIEASKARGETLDHLLVHGPPGLGKCITADSLILTDRGLVEFEALIPPKMAAQSSEEARVMVYGLNGLEPTSHIYASGRVPTRRLKTRSGFVLEGTPHHPLWTATPQGAAWKPLQELAPGDWVAVARGTEVWGQPCALAWHPDAPAHRRERSEAIVRQLHAGLQTTLQRAPLAAELRRTWSASCGTRHTPTAQKTARRLGLKLSDGRLWGASARCPGHNKTFGLELKPETAICLDAELGYLLGALVGDGHMEKGSGFPSFIITCEDAAMQHQLTLASQNVFGVTPQPRKYGDKATRMRFPQNMGKVCLAAGFRPALAASKTVPTAILAGPREAAIGFLQGLFDADGHARADGVEWGTRSEVLARQVQLLLLNLGIIAHRRMQQKVGAPFWCLFIGGREATRFCETVGFRLARKQNCLRQTVATGWQRSDFVPHAAELLTALLKQSLPQPRSVHKAFDHARRSDRHLTRSQIAKLLALLPVAVQIAPEYRVLQELMSPRIFWDRIESLEPGEAETYDFVVPGTHSFVANGFYNHNTTLAYIIAEELGREISITSGPALERPADVMPFLTNADDGDIIFIDEIHRLPRVVEEFLYSAMEDYMVNFTLDKGMYSKPLPFRLKKFTIVGATTRPAMLTRPLRDRFGIQQHLDFYGEADLVKIARRSAKILDVKMDSGGAHELARRARGTPRIVNRLLRRVRDYAQVRADGVISDEVAHAALRLEGIDDKGLDRLDHGVLRVIMETYNGGPVGIDALAATLNEEVDTLVDVVEPYLLKIGFLARTPSGRRITRRAYEHLGEPPPPGAISNQPSLLDEAYDTNESLRQKNKERRKDERGEDKDEAK